MPTPLMCYPLVAPLDCTLPPLLGPITCINIPLSCKLRPPLHQSAGRLHMNECHVKRGHQLLGLCEEAS